MSARDVIETLALVFAAGLVSEVVAGFLRIPRMVVLLAAGVVVGPEMADLLLFYGGLGLSLDVLRPVVVGLGLLAIPGVLITAFVTGTVAAVAFDIPFEAGLLIGAALAPTDPAILIPLFEHMRIRAKVVQTVIAESALNDVTGAVLALALASFVIEGEGSLASPFGDFLIDLGISTVLGAALGVVLAVTISTRRLGIWRESPIIAVLLVVVAGYFAIDYAGGSGYLGAFLAGLIVANMDRLGLGMHSHREDEMRLFTSASADIVVVFVFITLGANLPFDTIADEAVPALITLAALIFIARPLTVLACLLPDRRGRWSREELIFVSWTRETGVVPAALVGILVADGLEQGAELTTVVALAIVVTLLLQSTTKAWLARRLGLAEDG